MSESFDPYYQWLGIPPKDQPPHYYRLLAVEPLESNLEVIENAADRQMAHVRTFQSGEHSEHSQRLLNQLSAARLCLLTPEKKAAYDAKLRAYFKRPPAKQEPEADGTVFGEYELLDQIGTGGTGQVFKARHCTLGRVVALKILSRKATQSPKTVTRFRRKVQLMAQLSHPNLVAAHDAGERGEIHFLVMDYVDGTDLSTLARQFHPLPVEYVISYLVQAADALGYAHRNGVIHRNVKPSNILIDQSGLVKVIGLGLARVDVVSEADYGDALTQPGSTVGSLDYMAPEQCEDSTRIDERADVYSLGCTLYRVLVGQPPYPVKSQMKKVLAHRSAAIPRLQRHRPEVSDALEAVYCQMMAKDPAARYQSMDEVILALQAINEDLVRLVDDDEDSDDSSDQQLNDFLGWVADRDSQQ